MTIIRPNSISGINSITAKNTDQMKLYDSNGAWSHVRAGVITASSFSGPITGSTGTFGGDVTISGDLGVGGTITYEDVARVDATGISTFREGFGVGPLAGIALTAYKDGSIRTTGVITATTYYGSGANLTGIDATQIQTGNTSVQTVDTGSDGHVKVLTEGSERLRILANGNLGVGDATPTKVLTVGTDAPVVLLDDQSSRTLEIRGPSTTNNATVLTTSNHDLLLGTNNAEKLRIKTSGSVGVNETTPDFSGFGSNGGGIELDDVNSGFTALKVSHGAADMYLASAGSAVFISTRTNHDIIVEKNSAEVARFTANGLKVPSGKGIDFSSTSDASTGGSGSVSSEILDDYEYGTFTPDLTRWTGSAWWGATWTTAPTYALGRYVKVGRLVTVTMRLAGWELNSSSYNKYAGIQGLPFAAGGSDPVGSLICTYAGSIFNTDTATSFWVTAGATTATSNRFGDDNGSHNVWSSGSNKTIVVSGSYYANA